MKKSLCNHCAFIAAIFAVCLFVTSCDNPVNPGQKPNPEPAPSPAPQPAPAPSIEVPAPQQEPSTDASASIPQTPAPAADEAVETENVTVTLASINDVTGAGPHSHGALFNFGTRTVTVQVPKSLTSTADRAEKVKELLLLKLEMDGYSGCVLCGTNTGTGTPSAAALTGTGPIYVKQQPTTKQVQMTIMPITKNEVELGSGGPPLPKYEKPANLSGSVVVYARVLNTDGSATKVHDALTAAAVAKLGGAIDGTVYGIFDSPTPPDTGAVLAGGALADYSTIYVGKKLP